MDIEAIVQEEKEKEYFKKLAKYINSRYINSTVYPPKEKLFACLKECDMNDVKVVILGQDPYHQKGQAMGLSFSVPKGVKVPPSLVNIYKELQDDLGVDLPNHGDLTSWTKQGVLLMNTVLSVEDSNANCHKGKGWEIFTDRIMRELNDYDKPLVFILWGKPAQEKARLIDNPKHLLLKSVHPSPLSAYRGFFGSKPFSKANTFLKANGRNEIDWRIV
ncbi:uracil-DNA glycosylase [Breznakia sp. PF5-3]|uniref:uracil-DNA glycosylase n=1 Tax=unclassified Breznakia TaxID=2623764 RepID=UPI0024053D11|nr:MULTISPECIES: uracil-DNA glycosylase [unclassified Breznakia]MDF9824571.1 uracil-DNA glycosylase [Breznakia sp. PM6-1]MDF9835461.1 uracil-DNA glycosylase [Breznakia sp. PF5-3]MDF9837871.1 uracil-DNA glycosylase [Breznakia sp. PFB2-8]MDF9859836.1 uracil-DNA glycosylase [Breznakia sp. PH5-24]